MNHVRNMLLPLFLLSALAACGQSGPLYLPGNPSELQNPQSQVPEPPPQNAEDDEEDDESGEDGRDEDGLDDNGGT